MFGARFFGAAFFGPHYWGEIGLTPTFAAFWLVNLNQQVGPTPQQPSPR